MDKKFWYFVLASAIVALAVFLGYICVDLAVQLGISEKPITNI